jgi:transcriptional regulator PpsR
VSQGIDPLKPEAELVPFRRSGLASEMFGASMVADLAVAAGDVTLLVDGSGVVQDIAFGEADLAHSGLTEWLGRPWIETVTIESRPKVEAMLEPHGSGKQRWRQINQMIDGQDVPIKYLTLGAEKPGWFVAIGRDLRSTAALQQRLLQTQQAMERDYIRLRQAESRYRLLFNQAAEAVLILDSASRRVTEANPAAAELIGGSADSLVGRTIASLFHPDDRDRVIALLGSVAAAENVDPVDLRLARDAHDCRVAATLFRQGRGSFFLVRLAPGEEGSQTHSHPDRRLATILERIPDAFVVTDEDLNIVTENAAFLEMTQFARKEQVRGEALGRFLGRPGIDLNLLTAQLREHGSISNFATIMRDRYDTQDDVEVSAVTVSEGQQEWIGFTIRMVGRLREQRPAGDGITRSVEQLTELVGRVSLKEIVRESTDLIERLCIEAALTYTSDNRASAAEILGLSRQSLYSKLHRHGLANGQADADQAG